MLRRVGEVFIRRYNDLWVGPTDEFCVIWHDTESDAYYGVFASDCGGWTAGLREESWGRENQVPFRTRGAIPLEREVTKSGELYTEVLVKGQKREPDTFFLRKK